jgi:4-amino-4-deoxy-L-arabinose transferase-like glycosyltransferase
MAHTGTAAPAGAALPGSRPRSWRRGGRAAEAPRTLASLWPLGLLVVLAAALRFSTLGLQSLWFDEAFTPVHVFSSSLFTTLSHMARTENTPPLWYVLEWAMIRVAGDGAVALRFLSALAGVAMVPVMWAVGQELAGRRAAILAAALTATDPLFVWYSQEARAYALFAFFISLSMLCCLRAEREPTPRRMAAFALSGSLALLSHYFAVFLVAPMALWLARRRERARVAIPALAAVAIVAIALIPLVLTQGGHGAQWIGHWALASRLEAIPQYYLTGYTGSALGHGVELAVVLPLLAGVVYGLWQVLDAQESRGAALALGLTACGALIPLLLVAFGADYLAPRNLIGAMVPLTALLAIVIGARRTRWIGMLIGGLAALGFLAVVIDVDLRARLQRGNWSGVARLLHPLRGRAVVAVHLGTAPLEYYLPGLRGLPAGEPASVREIDEVGYPPLSAEAAVPPAPAFKLLARHDVSGLVVYQFVSGAPRAVSVSALRAHPITLEQGAPEVLGLLLQPRRQAVYVNENN